MNITNKNFSNLIMDFEMLSNFMIYLYPKTNNVYSLEKCQLYQNIIPFDNSAQLVKKNYENHKKNIKYKNIKKMQVDAEKKYENEKKMQSDATEKNKN